jgi:hypothetical protein
MLGTWRRQLNKEAAVRASGGSVIDGVRAFRHSPSA